MSFNAFRESLTAEPVHPDRWVVQTRFLCCALLVATIQIPRLVIL